MAYWQLNSPRSISIISTCHIWSPSDTFAIQHTGRCLWEEGVLQMLFFSNRKLLNTQTTIPFLCSYALPMTISSTTWPKVIKVEVAPISSRSISLCYDTTGFIWRGNTYMEGTVTKATMRIMSVKSGRHSACAWKSLTRNLQQYYECVQLIWCMATNDNLYWCYSIYMNCSTKFGYIYIYII